MNAVQKGVIGLVRASLTGEMIKIGDDFDWKSACIIGRRHNILPMLYYGALHTGAAMPVDYREYLRKKTLDSACVDQRQRQELDEIEASFLKNEIDYLPLKGMLLKEIYPQPELRMMGDADILIRMEQYDRIRVIMQDLGFEQTGESDPEIVWDKKGAVHLELHKRLFAPGNKDYFAYFGDGWKLAQNKQGTRYEMRNEDMFVYLFTHYAKHYRNGGIGIRHITDLYMFMQNRKMLDMGYIDCELEKLGLLTFYKNTLEMIKVWFFDAESNNISDFLTDKIFESGSYGTAEGQMLSAGVRELQVENCKHIKGRKMCTLIFPSAKALERNYPILKRCRLVLPFVWCHRWGNVLLFRRKSVKENLEKAEMLSARNILAWQADLDYVGLRFTIEE